MSGSISIQVIQRGTPEFAKAVAEVDEQIAEMERQMSDKTRKPLAERVEEHAANEKAAAEQMNQPEDAAAFEERMTDGVEAYISPEEAPTLSVSTEIESKNYEALLDARAEVADQAEIEKEFGPDDPNEEEDRLKEAAATNPPVSTTAPTPPTPSDSAQSIDIPQVEGVNKIHGLKEALSTPLDGANFTYHIFAQVIQPGTIGMICGLYAFPFRITTTDTYMQARLLVANQNNVEVGKLMFVNFVLLDG